MADRQCCEVGVGNKLAPGGGPKELGDQGKVVRRPKLERDHGGGINMGKAIAIGLAIGAGVILGLLVWALRFD